MSSEPIKIRKKEDKRQGNNILGIKFSEKSNLKEDNMFIKSKFRLNNQQMDLKLGRIDDEVKLKKLKGSFRRILFESEAFLLKESRETIMGIYADEEGAGTSLYQRNDMWFVNLGFNTMDFGHITDMVSRLQHLDEILKEFKGDVLFSIVYVLENAEKQKDQNSFLKEIVLSPPVCLIDDGIKRVFNIANSPEATIYTFSSMHEGLITLNEAVALFQKEKISTEKLFVPSLLCWLSSIKSPEPIKDPTSEIICFPRFINKNGSLH